MTQSIPSPLGTPEASEITKKGLKSEETFGSPTPPLKKIKLDTPEEEDKKDVTETGSAATEDKPLTKKQLEKLERQRQREVEKEERDRKKEEERKQKEEERRVKEEERRKKLEEKELEKEMRRKKLEDEKIEREKKKEEERLKKVAEREEKEKQRLDKKLKLELEKKRADEEKKKAEEAKKKAEEAKERSQMRISSFFTPKKEKEIETEKDADMAIEVERIETETIVADASNNEINICLTNSPSKSPKSIRSTYDKVFLPFFQKTNVIMANTTIKLSQDELAKHKSAFDSIILKKSTPSSYLEFMKTNTTTYEQTENPTPEQIIAALNSTETTETQIYNMIEKLPPVKYLQFYENSKPPYIGTWCSLEHKTVGFPRGNPYFKVPSGIDYEYDSDFDWNEDDDEDGEGEDIDNDDDEDDEEELEDEEEFEDFVDSNGDGQRMKKKKFMGPLISLSIWNDGSDNEFFNSMSYERINEKIEFPINPNHNYWSRKRTEDQKKSITTNGTGNTTESKTESTSTPPKSKASTNKATETSTPGAGSNLAITNIIGSNSSPNVLIAQKPKIKDAKAVLELIKFVEENNDFTIGTLVELSHKKFKSFTKAILKHTIQYIATYNKKSGKWEIDQEVKDKISSETETSTNVQLGPILSETKPEPIISRNEETTV